MYRRYDNVVFQKVEHPRRRITKARWNESMWDEYYEGEPFRSTRLLLGIYGVLPFTWKKPHLPSRHPLKSTLIISIIIAILIGFFEYHLVVSCYHTMIYGNLHLKDIIMEVEILLFSFFYLIYFASWVDVPVTEEAIKTWLHLGRLYYRMMGRQLTQRRRTVEKILNIGVVVFPVVSFTFSHVTNPQIKIQRSYYFVIVPSGSAVMMVCFLWITYFDSLKKLSEDINSNLQKDLHNKALTLKKLQDYRKIWLAMRSLSDCASALSATVAFYVLCFTLIIFVVYEMIVLFQSGSILSGMAHTDLCVTLVYFVNYMASASSNAVQQIKQFYTILARENLYSMSPNKQREVIGLYLVERSRPPAPTYGGFVFVNRALTTSVFASVSTYLVVLMQFSQSVSKSESQSTIPKNVTTI